MSRPRAFDTADVLHHALGLFWDQGYDGASIAELSQSTGLSRSSMYTAFGDKRGLFLAVLDYYRQTSGRRYRLIFDDPRGLAAGLEDYLMDRISGSLFPGMPQGCFFTALAGSLKTADQDLKAVVTQAIQASEAYIQEGFASALASGQVSPRMDALGWTQFYLAFTWGLNVAARLGRSQDDLEAMVKGFVSTLA